MRDKNTPKLLPTIVVVVVLLLGTAGIVLSKQLDSAKKASPRLTTVQNQQQAAVAADTTITYDGQEGKTALELLKDKANVVTKDSSYGTYVDTINGVKGGTDGKYWAFYINGNLAQVGADAYKTKTGDKIQWKFE